MIVIKSGRHPLAVSLLGFLAASGLSGLATYSHSASGTIRSLPHPLGVVFYGALAAGSVIAIVGVFMRGLLGPLLERTGLWTLSGFLSSYALLALVRVGWPALFVALLLFGLSVGSFLRAVQIGRELNQIREGAERVDALGELGGPRERWHPDRPPDRRRGVSGDDCGAAVHPPPVEKTDGGRGEE